MPSDTIGVANSRQVFDVFTLMREAHPDIEFGVLFTRTRGLAAVNVVAALEAEIASFDARSVGWVGIPTRPERRECGNG
jgi:hydroxymethylglutaryl-CoA lyase